MEMIFTLNAIISLIILGFIILTIYLGIKIVPQSNEYVIERFGKYSRTLTAGLSIIIPYLDKVAHKVSILERQLREFTISVISKDNVSFNDGIPSSPFSVLFNSITSKSSLGFTFSIVTGSSSYNAPFGKPRLVELLEESFSASSFSASSFFFWT